MTQATHQLDSMRARGRCLLALGAIAVTALLSGCGGDNPFDAGGPAGDGPVVTIGSQGTAENEILAQLYGQVLEQAGYDVRYQVSIETRPAFLEALSEGSLDLVPEYAASLLYESDPLASASSLEQVEAAIPRVLQSFEVVALDPAPAENVDALVVTAKFAAAHQLATINDLAPIAGALNIAADASFRQRWGDRLAKVYAVSDWTLIPSDTRDEASTLQNLIEEVVQVADFPSTAPTLKRNDLVVLGDPERLFPAQNVIPLLNSDLYSLETAALLNAVSAKLSTSELLDLNELYDSGAQPTAAEVATGWLIRNGFIKN